MIQSVIKGPRSYSLEASLVPTASRLNKCVCRAPKRRKLSPEPTVTTVTQQYTKLKQICVFRRYRLLGSSFGPPLELQLSFRYSCWSCSVGRARCLGCSSSPPLPYFGIVRGSLASGLVPRN